jgi:hypothetical protein
MGLPRPVANSCIAHRIARQHRACAPAAPPARFAIEASARPLSSAAVRAPRKVHTARGD